MEELFDGSAGLSLEQEGNKPLELGAWISFADRHGARLTCGSE